MSYAGEKEDIICRYYVATRRKSQFIDLSAHVDKRGDGGLPPGGIYTLRFRGAAGTAVSRVVLHY